MLEPKARMINRLINLFSKSANYKYFKIKMRQEI